MFIQKSDIEKAIRPEILQQITRGDDTLINVGIDAAVGEMKGYLGAYDTDAIFSTTGNNRNPLLLQFGIDIAIYNLIEIEQPGIDLEDRRARYKRAIAWLEEVKKGNINPGMLPPASPEADADTNPVQFGSTRPKRNNYY